MARALLQGRAVRAQAAAGHHGGVPGRAAVRAAAGAGLVRALLPAADELGASAHYQGNQLFEVRSVLWFWLLESSFRYHFNPKNAINIVIKTTILLA